VDDFYAVIVFSADHWKLYLLSVSFTLLVFRNSTTGLSSICLLSTI